MTILGWPCDGTSEHAAALLCEKHHTAWFSFDGLASVSNSLSGTLSGTSLGDVVFIAGSCVEPFDDWTWHMSVEYYFARARSLLGRPCSGPRIGGSFKQ